MAAESKLASTNQPLRLTLKALFATAALYLMRGSDFGFAQTLLYFSLLAVFYFRPPLNAARFLPSMAALGVAPLVIPRATGAEELTIVVGWGILYLIILGIKDVAIIHRREAHYFVHLALVAAFTALLFRSFQFTFQIALFVLFLFLFREFYFVQAAGAERERLNLIAGVGALLVVEAVWVASFLSVNFLAAAILLTLFVFAFHDTVLHRIRETLSREVVLRNAWLLGVLGALVLALPA